MKKKREKKWEEDEGEGDLHGRCSSGRHHTRDQHQTAWLKFQHSCHEEEASRPKGSIRSHCDAQGSVFIFVLHLLNCFLFLFFCTATSS